MLKRILVLSLLTIFVAISGCGGAEAENGGSLQSWSCWLTATCGPEGLLTPMVSNGTPQ